MTRVRVPLDLHTIAESGAGTFAMATPLRVRELLSLVVRQAIGARAPDDTFRRSLQTTLAGLRKGRFMLDVEGRRFDDPDDVIVCAETVEVRFYHPAARAARAEESGVR